MKKNIIVIIVFIILLLLVAYIHYGCNPATEDVDGAVPVTPATDTKPDSTDEADTVIEPMDLDLIPIEDITIDIEYLDLEDLID